jgi:hypothetical protein
MDSIHMTSLPPRRIKELVKQKGVNTCIIGAYIGGSIGDEKLFIMYNGLTEYIIPLSKFGQRNMQYILANGIYMQNDKLMSSGFALNYAIPELLTVKS